MTSSLESTINRGSSLVFVLLLVGSSKSAVGSLLLNILFLGKRGDTSTEEVHEEVHHGGIADWKACPLQLLVGSSKSAVPSLL